MRIQLTIKNYCQIRCFVLTFQNTKTYCMSLFSDIGLPIIPHKKQSLRLHYSNCCNLLLKHWSLHSSLFITCIVVFFVNSGSGNIIESYWSVGKVHPKLKVHVVQKVGHLWSTHLSMFTWNKFVNWKYRSNGPWLLHCTYIFQFIFISSSLIFFLCFFKLFFHVSW